MKDIDICYGLYASKWGLTDFYDESKKKLLDALESGEDFDTGWWGCKKEIRYARIMRDEGDILIEVSCEMDDLYDGVSLIYDALWESRRSEEELPFDIIESIRDAAIDELVGDSTSVEDYFPADGTPAELFDAIVDRINRLEEYAEASNDNMYKRLCEIVAGHYDWWKSQEKGEQA